MRDDDRFAAFIPGTAQRVLERGTNLIGDILILFLKICFTQKISHYVVFNG